MSDALSALVGTDAREWIVSEIMPVNAQTRIHVSRVRPDYVRDVERVVAWKPMPIYNVSEDGPYVNDFHTVELPYHTCPTDRNLLVAGRPAMNELYIQYVEAI